MSFRREEGEVRGAGGWMGSNRTRVGNYGSGQGECGGEAYEPREK